MMEESELLRVIQLYVDPTTAEKIMKNGLAEIVLRRKDKKYSSFVKAKIVNSRASEEAKKQIMDAVLRSSADDGRIAAKIRSTLKNVNLASKKLKSIDLGLKDVSLRVEKVLQLTSKVQALSFVNIGLSASNLAVDIVGFVVIANKMRGLSEQINGIAEELSKIKDISVEDMRSNCEKLYLDYNSFVTKIHDGDGLNRDDLEEYLKQAKTFLSKLIRLLQNRSVDAETLLNMIFTLLPAYTSVLCFFLRAYYFEKQATPLNYDSFLEVYQEIKSPGFQNAVQDYYFLERGYDYRDIIDILNVQLFTVFNERLEIEDQLELLKLFSTDEAYYELERSLDASVKKEVEEQAEDIAGRCGEYEAECKRVLQG